MKVLRFFCNLLLFIALSIAISLVQVGLYNLTALQSEDIPEIKLSTSEEDDISYFDNFSFWAEDIGENLKMESKYRIRNWASWKWWKNGMGWADKALDTVIAIIKPIVVPVAQVNAVNNFYGMEINDFNDYLILAYDGDLEKVNNALYEVYVIFEKGYGEAYTVVEKGETPVKISEYEYTGKVEIREDIDVEYARWVKRNGKLYNTIWKLTKYNSEVYDKYYTKFIDETNGVRHIKTAVTVLYYQQVVSIILSLFFVIKYPIALAQGKIVGKKEESL